MPPLSAVFLVAGFSIVPPSTTVVFFNVSVTLFSTISGAAFTFFSELAGTPVLSPDLLRLVAPWDFDGLDPKFVV